MAIRAGFSTTLVPGGFVIPFGVFRAFLDRPIEPGGPAAFDWMKDEYQTIADLADYPNAQGERARRATGSHGSAGACPRGILSPSH